MSLSVIFLCTVSACNCNSQMDGKPNISQGKVACSGCVVLSILLVVNSSFELIGTTDRRMGLWCFRRAVAGVDMSMADSG